MEGSKMKEIPLTQNKVALVDDADYHRVSHWKWFAHKEGNTFYAYSTVMGKKVPMQKLILNVGTEILIDHKNGDGLDNRKCNLRNCTAAQNMWNAKCANGKTSSFRGVSKRNYNKKDRWQAGIEVYGVRYYLGTFNTEIGAAQAYNEAAIKHYGEFARLNKIKVA